MKPTRRPDFLHSERRSIEDPIQCSYARMKASPERNTPIDDAAFHLHLGLDNNINRDDVQSNVQRLQTLGLEVQMSELDVRTQDVDLPLAEKIALQADV